MGIWPFSKACKERLGDTRPCIMAQETKSHKSTSASSGELSCDCLGRNPEKTRPRRVKPCCHHVASKNILRACSVCLAGSRLPVPLPSKCQAVGVLSGVDRVVHKCNLHTPRLLYNNVALKVAHARDPQTLTRLPPEHGPTLAATGVGTQHTAILLPPGLAVRVVTLDPWHGR